MFQAPRQHNYSKSVHYYKKKSTFSEQVITSHESFKQTENVVCEVESHEVFKKDLHPAKHLDVVVFYFDYF